MIAGALEIQLFANMARLAKDMSEAKSTVEKSMSGIETAVAKAKTVLAALGIALSVGYFVSLVNGTISAMDHLADLRKSTNVSIEDLAGLGLAAKQSGGDLDSVAASINKLSVNIGKEPERFRALGISAKEPLEQLKQLADIYVALDDPGQRAAVAAAALGKSWAGTAPLLAEGSKRIAEMVENGARLSGVTAESAAQAKIYHDQMAELNVILGATRTKLVGDMLPGMNEIALAMQEAAKEGGALLTIWVGLGGAMAHMLGLSDAQRTASRLREISDELDAARKRLQSGTTNPEGSNKHFFSFLVSDIKFGEEAKAKLKATIDALEQERERLAPKPKAKVVQDGADEKAIAAVIAEEKARQFLRDADAYAARVAQIKGFAATYAAEIKTQGTLADLAFREGGINNQRTQEELILKQSELEDKKLRSQLLAFTKLKAEADKQGKKEESAKNAELIVQTNAAIVANETITQARIRAERTITAQQQTDQHNAAIAAREAQGAALADSLRSATDRENNEYQNRLINLGVYLSSAQGQIADDAALRQALEMQHQQNLLAIERDKHQAERSMQIGTWQLGAELLQQFAGKSKAAAIAVIAINKGLAIAQAIQATSVAVMRAYSDLGPIAGSAAAVGIEALGAVQIGLIGATGLVEAGNVGSGGGGGMGGGSPSMGGGGSSISAAPVTASAPAAPAQTTIIDMSGLRDDDFFSGKMMRKFVEKIEEGHLNGDRLVVAH